MRSGGVNRPKAGFFQEGCLGSELHLRYSKDPQLRNKNIQDDFWLIKDRLCKNHYRIGTLSTSTELMRVFTIFLKIIK